jgi:hypothetical protein
MKTVLSICLTNYTPGYAFGVDYGHLIEGHIGELTTLITAEVDAVFRRSKKSIKLKCRQRINDTYFPDKPLPILEDLPVIKDLPILKDPFGQII